MDILKCYNPRISGREAEIAPEVIFSEAIANWSCKPCIEKVIDDFFAGLSLDASIFDYSVDVINSCKKKGYKVACLTDLPNGMPDNMFKNAIIDIINLFDLYVLLYSFQSLN